MSKKVTQFTDASKRAYSLVNSPEVKAAFELIKKQFGIIERCESVNINGDKGFLVWDYILFNEITFVHSDTGKHVSMYKRESDEKTEAEFNRIVAQFPA